MTNPPLFDVVDTLYRSVMDNMPQALQERSMISAFALGSVGTFGVVRGLQWLSKNVVAKVTPDFHHRVLPTLERLCLVSMAAIPFVYAAVDPEGAREIMTQHPTYTSGMAGVYVGSILGALKGLKEERRFQYYLRRP